MELIDRKDLKIEPYRTAEQKLNENARGVRVTHIPTGAVADCDDCRTYPENLKAAITMLELGLSLKEHLEDSEMKSLFREDEAYTEEALELDLKVINALRPIFEEYVKFGYTIREIGNIAMLAANDITLEMLINKIHMGL